MKRLIIAILLAILWTNSALAITAEPSRIDMRLTAPPANDLFINAQQINGIPGAREGTNVDATKEPGEPFHAGNSGGRSVWYRWIAPGNCGITFSTKNTGTDFDTLLAVYVGVSVNSIAPITASDNFGAGGKSSVTFAAVGGVTYYIAVDGSNPGTGADSGSFYLHWTLNQKAARGADLDGGDSVDDITLFRPSTGLWATFLSDNYGVYGQWGTNGDIPVAADYDGDGKTDYAVFRPSTGVWYILGSLSGGVGTARWGSAGDIPVMGDYNADGYADLGVFRPSNGTWWVADFRHNMTTLVSRQWGTPGDKPVQADYDADGRTDIAVYRPTEGMWYIMRSENNSAQYIRWGSMHDVPVPGDYGAKVDGKTDAAVYRPADGTWYVLASLDGSSSAIPWGIADDVPQPMSGFVQNLIVNTDYAVFRASTGTWYIRDSTTGETKVRPWGSVGDIPATSAYNVQLANVARDSK